MRTAHEFPLPLPEGLTHNSRMDENGHRQPPTRSLIGWATTPPQSYAVYLIALFLIFGLSFYAGTMKPKGVKPLSPAPGAAPHN